MRTLLVTGGTDGIGRALAMRFLGEGYQVVAVGSSAAKGERLLSEAAAVRAADRVVFLQADLSLPSENRRVMEFVRERWDHLDALVLCAASLRPQDSYRETVEGYEFTFSLYYLSRFILSHGLRDLLEAAHEPVVVNVAAPGMGGAVSWDDLQLARSYDGQAAQFHGSRLNDLLGVRFAAADPQGKIRYVLFNPMAAKTAGASAMASGPLGPLMRLYYQVAGKTPGQVADIAFQHLGKAHRGGLEAYLLRRPVKLSGRTFDPMSAERLDRLTRDLLGDEHGP